MVERVAIMEEKKVNCRECKYFYITWDKSSPYGCKSMGFKSRILPSLVVIQTTGTTCLSFHDKLTAK